MSGLASAIDELSMQDAQLLPDTALGSDLVEMRRQIDRLEAQWLRRLQVFDARGGGEVDSFPSTASWLRASCRMTHTAAREAVLVARALQERLTGTAAAFEAGEVSYGHARVLARETDALPTETLAEAEPTLLDTAREHDPAMTRRVAVHLRHVVDVVGAREVAELAHERRGLHASTTWDGMVAGDFLLDTETGALLLSALMPLAAPAGPDDRRSPAQRRADALGEMARLVLHGTALPELGGERPHLNVVVDLATLSQAPGAPAAEADWAPGPLTGEAARRVACDAAVVRVITDGPSQVLDVGRATRTIPPAIRRALAVRDGGCVFDGCDRPPAWTDAHHIVHWADGGPTCLDNLCLLCRRHHRLVHEQGWSITTDPGGRKRAGPPRTRARP